MEKRKPKRRLASRAPLFAIEPGAGVGLQDQIRQKLVEIIVAGILPLGSRLPSSRKLAEQLGVARNTVVIAYQQLLADGVVVSRERSGLYVSEEFARTNLRSERIGGPLEAAAPTKWRARMRQNPMPAPTFRAPPDWQQYPFPFVAGQCERSLFPVAEWREATRLALGVREINRWSTDTGDADDPMLINEIRTKILPRRGIEATADQILITTGGQQALYLLTELLADKSTTAAVEEPGHPEIRQLLMRRGATLVHQPVDREGVVVDGALDKCDLVYVTPSHQRPTAATMSMERRRTLLERARKNDFVVIEDDFECESTDPEHTFPALMSLDHGGHVIYVATFSRVLSAGLRLGFIVGPSDVIAEARRLRQLTTRHPPLNNQRTAALFLSLGHYHALMARAGREFRARFMALRDALNHYLQAYVEIPPMQDGTAFWVKLPKNLDATEIARRAEARGLLIEPAADYFGIEKTNNYFRMGITSLRREAIRPGVALLADIVRELLSPETSEPIVRHDWLKGPALRKAMRGATLLCKTVYGDPCTIELLPDGQMVGRAGYANEDQDTGRWWVEGDRWYRHWNAWAYGEVANYAIRLDGDRLEFFNARGQKVDTTLIVRANKAAA